MTLAAYSISLTSVKKGDLTACAILALGLSAWIASLVASFACCATWWAVPLVDCARAKRAAEIPTAPAMRTGVDVRVSYQVIRGASKSR